MDHWVLIDVTVMSTTQFTSSLRRDRVATLGCRIQTESFKLTPVEQVHPAGVCPHSTDLCPLSWNVYLFVFLGTRTTHGVPWPEAVPWFGVQRAAERLSAQLKYGRRVPTLSIDLDCLLV